MNAIILAGDIAGLAFIIIAFMGMVCSNMAKTGERLMSEVR